MIVRLKSLRQAKRRGNLPVSSYYPTKPPRRAIPTSRRSMPGYRHRDRMAASPLKVSIAK
jgi:hypothetical protein